MKNKDIKLYNFIRNHRVRILLCGVLAMTLFVTPALTQAQYKWTLNGYNIIQAAEFYFNGNYMHESGKNSYYATTGWDGGELNLPDIEIRNFDNALLANKEKEDIYYRMRWTIQTYGADGEPVADAQKCNLTVSSSDGSQITQTTLSNGSYSGSSTGDIIGDGNPKKHTYKMMVTPPSGVTLEPGSYVLIWMTATNVDKNDNGTYGTTSSSYQRTISATFRYTVSTAASYVKQFDPSDQAESWAMELTLGTGSIPGMDAQQQTVNVWWDMEALEINPFNAVFSAMSQQNNYTTTTVNGKQYGILKITGLGSNAIRVLDFNKKTYNGKSNTAQWTSSENTEENGLTAWNTKPENAGGKILGFYLDEQQTGN